MVSAATSRTAADRRRRSRLRRTGAPGTALAASSASLSERSELMASPWCEDGTAAENVTSLQEIDHAEQRDPDDVDKMPVVRDDDRRGRLRGGEPAHGGTDHEQDERDETTGDVQAG